jgi:hypothetical protein
MRIEVKVSWGAVEVEVEVGVGVEGLQVVVSLMNGFN